MNSNAADTNKYDYVDEMDRYALESEIDYFEKFDTRRIPRREWPEWGIMPEDFEPFEAFLREYLPILDQALRNLGPEPDEIDALFSTPGTSDIVGELTMDGEVVPVRLERKQETLDQ